MTFLHDVRKNIEDGVKWYLERFNVTSIKDLTPEDLKAIQTGAMRSFSEDDLYEGVEIVGTISYITGAWHAFHS